MGRKNHRSETSEPLDVEQVSIEVRSTPTSIRTYRRVESYEEREARLDEEAGRRRQRNQKRADARIETALLGKWGFCCIPGCEGVNAWWTEHKRYEVATTLPLCDRHLVLISHQAQPMWRNDDIRAAREKFGRQWVDRQVVNERKADIIEENGGFEQGHIYFVRINGVIKVGWSKKLRSRLKSYGASAEILCHYPAPRSEETDMHRNLRPYLAKGREWYQDCQLIADVVAKIIAQHGQPYILPYWTTPKPDVICKRSA